MKAEAGASAGATSVDERALVHRLASAYLAAEAPKRSGELDGVFAPAYAAVAPHLDAAETAPDERGTPFDPTFGAGIFVASVVWTAAHLVHAALSASTPREWTQRFRRLEPRLLRQTASPEMIAELKGILTRMLEQGLSPTTGSKNPDLQVLVDLDRRERRLAFQLRAEDPALGLTYSPFVAPPFEHDPAAYFQQLFADVDGLAVDGQEERAVARRKLEAIGAQLADRLLPPELNRLLGSLAGKVSTVEILSDEPWIPWELLRLPASGPGGARFGPFLCEAFAVTRWLRGRPQALSLPLREIALMAPRDSGLPESAAERDFLLGLTAGERRVETIPATYLEVTRALGAGNHDGWHFAGHGAARGDNPDRWGLALERHETLTPRDLHGIDLGPGHPFVFLNACHSARGGVALTGIAGLAQQFLAAGAGAVLGSHWTLGDAKAAAFAATFYPLFLAGLPLGEAVRRSRLDLRDRFPGDPAWLAYTAFGHPLASTGA